MLSVVGFDLGYSLSYRFWPQFVVFGVFIKETSILQVPQKIRSCLPYYYACPYLSQVLIIHYTVTYACYSKLKARMSVYFHHYCNLMV